MRSPSFGLLAMALAVFAPDGCATLFDIICDGGVSILGFEFGP